MRIHDADLSRESYVSERVGACRTRASIVPGKADDVGVCFGDADGDDADAGHNRYFDRNARLGVDGLELFGELVKVLDRINIMIVGWGDQVYTRQCMARSC